MAPLGIITAIVGAIRVGGPPWLRAVIGRARENRAAPEAELMSSTSHEVCELWNGQAVVRVFGRPEIQQLIFLDDCEDMENFGIYTVTTAEDEGYLKRKRMKKLIAYRLKFTDSLQTLACDDPLVSQLDCVSQSAAAVINAVNSESNSFPVVGPG